MLKDKVIEQKHENESETHTTNTTNQIFRCSPGLPGISVPACIPSDDAIILHIHSRSLVKIVHVEDQPLAGCAFLRSRLATAFAAVSGIERLGTLERASASQ